MKKSSSPERRYIIKKYVHAVDIEAAIKQERLQSPDDIQLDETFPKAEPLNAIGFSSD